MLRLIIQRFQRRNKVSQNRTKWQTPQTSAFVSNGPSYGWDGPQSHTHWIILTLISNIWESRVAPLVNNPIYHLTAEGVWFRGLLLFLIVWAPFLLVWTSFPCVCFLLVCYGFFPHSLRAGVLSWVPATLAWATIKTGPWVISKGPIKEGKILLCFVWKNFENSCWGDLWIPKYHPPLGYTNVHVHCIILEIGILKNSTGQNWYFTWLVSWIATILNREFRTFRLLLIKHGHFFFFCFPGKWNEKLVLIFCGLPFSLFYVDSFFQWKAQFYLDPSNLNSRAVPVPGLGGPARLTSLAH